MTKRHVGIQVGHEPVQLVKADTAEVHWELDIGSAVRDGQLDFRGRAVDGMRGDRFVYLTRRGGERRQRGRDAPTSKADAESIDASVVGCAWMPGGCSPELI